MTPSATLQTLLTARKSVRGFLPTQVPSATFAQLLTMAQQAPSWCNIQPWRVHLTQPPYTAEVAAALVDAAQSQVPQAELPFITQYPSPYREHRRACGGALYHAMGIARDDHAGRARANLRNFELFDAPHLMVVSCDAALGPYAYLDVGVWLGVLLTSAQALGLGMCAMASVATYPAVLRRMLAIPAAQTILFGIAVGYEDVSVPANQCRTTRAPFTDNLTIVDKAPL